MPPIQVLHGQPTPEELATVLAVVSVRAAAAEAAAQAAARADGPASAWDDRARRLAPTPQPGPSAWRTSGWAAWR
ncbi:acyl-CoA carboxylase subunit epsilon [Kitasatospora sp. McL0602]|uniref:acyl-CoA carboxylase subunit epsilon n=1 Tax=Kitasatospora sp. McL0602 TaxID=3439530 RepID=UPI003F8BC992